MTNYSLGSRRRGEKCSGQADRRMHFDMTGRTKQMRGIAG